MCLFGPSLYYFQCNTVHLPGWCFDLWMQLKGIRCVTSCETPAVAQVTFQDWQWMQSTWRMMTERPVIIFHLREVLEMDMHVCTQRVKYVWGLTSVYVLLSCTWLLCLEEWKWKRLCLFTPHEDCSKTTPPHPVHLSSVQWAQLVQLIVQTNIWI